MTDTSAIKALIAENQGSPLAAVAQVLLDNVEFWAALDKDSSKDALSRANEIAGRK